jgi:hypothetical protein
MGQRRFIPHCLNQLYNNCNRAGCESRSSVSVCLATAVLAIRKEGVLRIFITLKNPLPWLGSIPQPLGPVASTLTTTPPRRLILYRSLIRKENFYRNFMNKNTRHKKSKAVPLYAMEALGGRGEIAPTHSRPRH